MSGQVIQYRDTAILNLSRWFQRRQRVLPWRSEPTPYRVWVSEIMLQQTQVTTVLPYFDRFMQRFPTLESLAHAQESQVLEVWAGLGYYSRARNLHRGAQQMLRDGIPQTREQWLEIPGVGPYTAGAVASIALEKVEPILDGNVERVLARILALSRKPHESAFKARLWRWSKILVHRAHRLGVPPSQFNQALMELGALVCTFRTPACLDCPVRERCSARVQNRVDQFPGQKAAKAWVHVEELRHAWILRTGAARSRLLLRKQMKGEWREGLWDFPAQAPASEGSRLLGEVKTRHVVTRHKIERTTQVWSVSAQEASAFPPDGASYSWVQFEDPELPGSSAFKKTWAGILQFDPRGISR